MKSIFDSCTPRDEVLSGELKEDIFAARLKDVVQGTAEDVYQQPELFFRNTFPTEGMKTLLQESLGRLTGERPNSNPILRLETAFGGGKTHNLIALYHVAQGNVPPAVLADIVEPELIPRAGAVDIAAVVGNDLSPTDGLQHEDGTRTYTLWGELAYQLGGRAGYALARESDVSRTAPGTGLFETLVGNKPTLVLIDEIARHMRVAQGVPTATGKSDLAEQTVAFLMALLEWTASRSSVVVVLTMAGTNDAFSKETQQLQQQLNEARRVMARQEMVITPTDETELAAIVTHRLFKHIDPGAAEAAARAYSEAYKQWFDQGVEIPQRAVRAEYAQDLRHDYPFHPELLNTLNRKTSTIPNFQKTRGALRLLALVVRELWRRHPSDTYLIHPYHLDLAHVEIANDLTSRLERPAFKQVIEADIVSDKLGFEAKAQAVDEGWVVTGKPPYARYVATTVFLHSLTQGVASGVDPADLRVAVLDPRMEPLLVNRATERLIDTAWFMEWDGHRFRFKTEPALNKIVADEMGLIGRIRAKQELDSRIRQMWKGGTFKPVFFPQEAVDLDDDAKLPKLAIIGYDAAAIEQENEPPPELVRRLAEYSGMQNSFRVYQNNVLFLVADEGLIENMVEVAQRYLAINRIVGDAERMHSFTEEQRKKLKKMGEAAELEVRVAVSRAYRHLFFPRAGAPKAHSQLEHAVLPPQDQGDARKDQSEVVLRILRSHNKVLTNDEKPLAAPYIKARAWDQNQQSMTTEELRARFARRMGLPILFDLNQLKRTIKNGIDNRTWLYFDAAAELGYDHESPPPAIQISDEVYLYTPEEAARLGLPIKGKLPVAISGSENGGVKVEEARCPVCGNPESRCTCGDELPSFLPLRGEGPPQQAFQQLLDACHDQKIARLASIRLSVKGNDAEGAQNMRAIGLVLPQLGRGEYRIELEQYAAEFGAEGQLMIRAVLSDALYKRLRQVTDSLAAEASAFHVRLVLHMSYADGLTLNGDTFRTMHEVLTTMGLGRIQLEATAMAEGSGS